MRLAVLHGPNLNRLGRRQPEKYGTATLDDIVRDVDDTAERLGVTASHFQSNYEGALVEWIHDQCAEIDGIVINPAGFSAYGYSLLDALRDTGHPFAVVHISQWHAFDGKDRTDIFAGSAAIYLSGAGWRGYSLALEGLVHKLRNAGHDSGFAHR